MHPRLLPVALLLPLLPACGEVRSPAEVAFDDYGQLAQEIGGRWAAAPATPAGAIPVTGTAVYEGTSQLTLGTPTPTVLRGDSRIDVDFFADSFDGRMGNWVGSVNGGTTRFYDGEVAIAFGEIDVTQTLPLSAEVLGFLSGGGDTILVDGDINGRFRGATAPGAVEAKTDSATTFRLNGVATPGSISLIAE